MKITDDDDRDDAPVLPKRAVLEAWTVPEPAQDLTDRVLAHVDASPLGARPDAAPDAPDVPDAPDAPDAPVVALPRRRGGLGLAVVGVAMVAAAALVLGLVQLWRASPPEDARAAAVAAPAPAPAPALARAPSSSADEAITLRLAADPSAASGRPVPVSPSLEEPDAARAAAHEESLRKPKPKPDPKATATLRIGTARGESPAKVSIDGKPVGSTPLMNVNVSPGRHTVRWTWPDGTTATVKVTLERGETKVLKGSPGDGEASSP